MSPEPSQRIKVLLVDDEDAFRETLAHALERRGFEVRGASSGEECLEVLTFEDFDVVLLDLEMPGMGGLAALPEVARRRPLAKVVVMTGHGTLAKGIAAMKAHAFDFLSKPVMADELVPVILAAAEARDRRSA